MKTGHSLLLDFGEAGALRGSRLLGHLNGEQLVRLRKDGEMRYFAAGEAMLLASDICSLVFFVLSGVFQTSKMTPDGRFLTLRLARPGDQLGEIEALSGDETREQSVRCDKAGICFVLPARAFCALIAADSAIAAATLKAVAAEAQHRADRIYELATLDVRSRLLAELARLARDGVSDGARIRITPAPTHEALAAQIGSSREGVTRYLQEFAQRRWICVPRRGVIEITDLAAMHAKIARRTDAKVSGASSKPIRDRARKPDSVAATALLALALLELSPLGETAFTNTNDRAGSTVGMSVAKR